MSLIEDIAREAEAAFTQGITGQQFTERFNILVDYVGELEGSLMNFEDSLKCAHLDISQSSACFRIDVFSSETFAIFISILNPGIDFPLHDTPGRYGILKVIQGSVKISTYTAVAGDNANIAVPEDVRARVDSLQGSKAVFIPVNRHYYSTDLEQHNAPFILRPQEGNIHYVICASDYQAAFIKVLAPPYDMVNRVWTYKVIRSAKEDAATNFWLVKSDADMFLCSTLPYLGPRIEL